MFSFLGFILVVILIFWIASVSNRLAVLEKGLKQGSVMSPPPQVPAASTLNSLPAVSSYAPQVTAPAAQVTATDSNILGRLGIAALVLGLGFFFKYSIDQGWINEWARVCIGLVIALLMVVLGIMWKKQYGTRAEALSGGGIAVGFFSLYAGHIFYSLYGYNVAIVAYIILAAIAISLAFVKDSRPLASIGLIGAFGAPLFFGLHADQQVFIICYLSILSIGSLFLFTFRQWLEMPVLSLTAASVVFVAWLMNFSTPGTSLLSWFFSSALMLIYSFGATLSFRIRSLKNTLSPDSDSGMAIIVFISALQFFVFSEMLLSPWHPELKPFAGLLGGVSMLICYILVDRLEPKNLNYTSIFSAAVLLLAAIVWKFGPEGQIYLILALAILGFAAGWIQKREELRVASVAVALFAVAKSLLIKYGYTDEAFLLNAKVGLTLLSILVLGSFAWAYRKLDVSKKEKESSDTILVFAAGILWIAISWDITNAYATDLLQNTRNLLITFWWITLAVGTLAMGRALETRILKRFSLFLFGISIIKAFLYDVWALDLVYRIIAFTTLGVILLTLSFVYNRDKNKITKLFE